MAQKRTKFVLRALPIWSEDFHNSGPFGVVTALISGWDVTEITPFGGPLGRLTAPSYTVHYKNVTFE